MCGFDSCYPCLSLFNNKKLRYFNKKKTKLINFYKKYYEKKSFFFINIKNDYSPIFYFFRKIKIDPYIFKITHNDLTILKFKNFFLNFYFTNLNKNNLNSFLNFTFFFFKIDIFNFKNFFKNNKLHAYWYLLFNSKYNLFNFSTIKSFFDVFSKITLNPLTPIFFNLERSFFLKIQNYNNNNNLIKNNTNQFFIKKLIYFKFRILKIIKNNSVYNIFLSRFFFQNLYNSLDRKLNFNLTIFKIIKSDWITPTLARLTRFSINFNANDFLHFKTFFVNNDNLNYNIINLLNMYSINDNILENSYFVFSINNLKKSFIYNFFINKNSLIKMSKSNNNFKNLINSNLRLSSFFHKLYCNYSKKTFFNNFFFFKLNRFNFFLIFFFKPTFFKFLNFKNNFDNMNKNFLNYLNNQVADHFFYKKKEFFFNNNLIPLNNFSYTLKKKVIKIFSYSKFSTTTFLWNYNNLIRFLEFVSGKKICIKFFNFLTSLLNFDEKAQCLIWSQKVKYFRKVLGPRLFLNESIQIIYLSLKLKDPYFLSNWMVSTMYKISFWKYKTFLRYIKYVLRYFFWVIFKELKIKGIKFQLKGKVSVAGNARTRTVFQNVGYTSHTTFNNKILYHLNLVKSFTGVMGLKLWIVF